MEYMDDKGKVYEISYSQKLQREQNKLLRQKNMLIFCILLMILAFGAGLVYLYTRLEAIDFLTRAMVVLTKGV